MRLLLLNQYGPTSGAPTGRILAELGDGLKTLGHEVVPLEFDRHYGVSRRGRQRILHEIRAHLSLLSRGLLLPRMDAVISLTSPACLAVTAGILARLHRARHFHWAMDLYPDLGVLLKELPEGWIARLLTRLMRRAYRKAARVIALDEDMRDYLHRVYGVEAEVMEPFPPEVAWPAESAPRDQARRWLYSGNLGRAHEIDVLLRVQKRLEEQGVPARLVLQGKGAQVASSQDAATRIQVRQVEWRPPTPAEELGRSLKEADVLVVTRVAELQGLLLPSKLMLAELSGQAILWIGDTESQTARRLRKAGHGVFGPQDVDAIAAWLETIFASTPNGQLTPPRSTRSAREQAVARWDTYLRLPSP